MTYDPNEDEEYLRLKYRAEYSNTPTGELLETTGRLIELSEAKIRTLKELRKLILIAVTLGRPLSQIKRKISTRVVADGIVHHRWRRMTYIIHVEGEEPVIYPLMSVPLELWPEDVAAEFRRFKRRKTT